MSKLRKTSTGRALPAKKRRTWTANLATELKQWAMRPTSFLIQEFYTSRDIPKSTFYDAKADDKELQEAFEFARARIGINMFNWGKEKDLTLNHVATFTLPQHIDDFKEEQENRAKLKQDQNVATADSIRAAFIEMMKPMPRTNVVKDK